MKFILNFLKWIFISFLLIFSNYIISYFLPSPWNNINIFFLAIIIYIMGWESGLSIWFSCFLHFFLEIYSISHFGMILLPSTISVIFAYWLYIFIFTNRSWTSGIALTAITLIIYRFLYVLAFLLLEYLNKGSNILWPAFFMRYVWEIVITSIFAGIIVFIFSKIWKRFDPERMEI